MGIVEEFNVEDDEITVGLQETYNSLLEKSGEYARVAKTAIKMMKRAEEDYGSLLVRYKETKCEMETLNGELTEAYSKIKFLELEVIQTNAKVKQVSSKNLDDVLAHQKPFSDRSGLGYIDESSLSVKVSKDMKFVKAKEPIVEITTVEKVKAEKKRNVTDQRMLIKPRNQSVVIQTNAKVKQVSSKKLDDVLAHQKPFSDRSGLGYIDESSLSVKVSKDMKFVKAKEPIVEITTVEKVKAEKKRNVTDQRMLIKPRNQSVVKPEAKGNSLPKSQRSPRTKHFCHHCGLQGHTRPNYHKIRALKNASSQRSGGPRNEKRNWTAEQSKGQEGDSRVVDVMKMIDAFTTRLASFTRRFESHNTHT